VPLIVYNTLARAKVPFEPIEPGKVRMYVCGPTVYDSCHLGHARHGVVWDAIRRYLEYSGHEVTYVVNITDVDDKIIARANDRGVGWRDVTSRYVPEYFADMAALGVRRPTVQPRATEHVQDMIAAVEKLVAEGFAYVVDGSVYFEVSKSAGYGKLSGRRPDDETVARVEPDERKHHPADFALWKASKPGEPAWPTPWGEGRPGWHIECSVMSAKYLGATFDIHGGGEDLIFPHHENEIAQAEALTGRPFARYWLHNGFITVRKEKMSKSLGNVETLRDILGRYAGSVLRFFFLGAHYRSPIEFSRERLDEAAAGLERIHNCLDSVDLRLRGKVDAPAPDIEKATAGAREAFVRHMDDDFNTAGAIGAIFDLVAAVNAVLASRQADDAELRKLDVATEALRELLGVLGLPAVREAAAGGREKDLAELAVWARAEARKAKQYALADEVRARLASLGITVEDMPDGNARIVY